MACTSSGTSYEDAVFRHGATAGEFFDARDSWNGNGWTMTLADGRQFALPEAYFAKSYAQGAPTEMRDTLGNRIQLKRNEVRNLQCLLSPSGHTNTLKYDEANRIIEATDDAGNVRRYTYDFGGHVRTVEDAKHVLDRFEYQRRMNQKGYDPYLLTAVFDEHGTKLLENFYRDHSRVSGQQLADGENYRYEYALDFNGNVLQAIVTGPGGQRRSFFFKNGVIAVEK